MEAARRWRRLVRDRLAEMERLRPGGGAVGAAFWDGRAKRFASRLPPPGAERDPVLARLRRATTARSTVLDVGAGPGRHSLPIARRVRAVTAVDPSARMLAILGRRAREQSITNVTRVQGRWEDVDVPVADVVLSSFVMTLVPDAPAFLTKLDRHATHRVFLHLGAYSMDALLDPLWRHFHGAPRRPGPTYLDALAVLCELGIEPAVEVVEVPDRRRFASVAEAATEYRDHLVLPRTAAARRELEGLLASWLVTRGGALAAPLRTLPAAIITWTPTRRPGQAVIPRRDRSPQRPAPSQDRPEPRS